MEIGNALPLEASNNDGYADHCSNDRAGQSSMYG